MGVIKQASDVGAMAASVPDSGGVIFVPALTGLGAPYWDANAKGAIVGLTRGTTAAHIVRAAVESIAFQSAALMRAMNRDATIPMKELRVDGGAAANNYLLQFQADLLGVPVVRPKIIETTVLGAAYLAGLAVGVYKNVEEINQHWKIDRTFSPSMHGDDAEDMMQQWDLAVKKVMLN